MPEYTYAGQLPRHYTETRDTAGELLGLIQQGDKRDLDTAPSDGLWVEGDAKVAEPWPDVSPDMYRQEPAPAPGEADDEEGADEDGGSSEDGDPPAARTRRGSSRPPAGDPPTGTGADGGASGEE